MPSPRIAIAGAGLSGLMCARILQQHGVPVTVHELDPDRRTRQQGGSLDIHDDTGQIALREAGLLDDCLQHAHPEGQAIRVLDKDARVHIDHPDTGAGGRPEVDRTVLRRLLIDSLEPGTIRWGERVAGVRRTPDGLVLDLTDGRTEKADLIIGADGAWSRVRLILTDVRPSYTGITLVEIQLSDAVTRYPEARAVVGTGSFFALSDSRYIGGHGGDSLRLGLGVRVPEDWAADDGIAWSNAPLARQALLAMFKGWAPQLTNLIRDCDDLIVPRRIFAMPIGHVWDHAGDVTLVGDAAHLMSPFAGEGANLALIDGADLAREILDHETIGDAVAAYEEVMFPRGAKSAAESDGGLRMIFNDDSPKALVKFFSQMPG
jgi:2-polyprenyl-6-methoxyphenol hydroxylase-like FAD-dependent oxidoreductase